MRNNNGAAVRRLSKRSLKNNRMRNGMAILAIILTGMLFTAAFSLGSGMLQVAQEKTMHEVGGRFHAGLKDAAWEQYEKVKADPRVKRCNYNIYLGYAENILKRHAELRYVPNEDQLKDWFITLEEGGLPAAENEIVVDTIVMEELKIPCALGEKIPLTFTFMGKTWEKEFTVSGWYQGDLVSHASELFLSETFWEEVRGDCTEEDILQWQQLHPEDNGAGLMAVNLFFDNASNIEEKVRAVITDAGYEPGTELRYGVNWAYMESRIDAVDPLTLAILGGAVLVILLTGYLIIYNIFQISVMSDIRFYGLLKTIGTTKRQIRRMVNRQAVILSAIGIPVGLLAGYGIGMATLPFVLSVEQDQRMEVSLKFNPWILIFGTLFSAVTVFLSCRKPGKIAGSVSPIEAVKYTENGGSGRKKKKKKGKFGLVSMAFSNLGRNKKKTAVVVAAISLSMILLTVVMTGVGSFQIDSFLDQRIVGDYLLGSVNITSASPRSGDFELEEAFLALADSQEGILERNEMWWSCGRNIRMDEEVLKRYRELDQQGKLDRSEFCIEQLEKTLAGEEALDGYAYGYDDALLKNLKVLEGTLDIEKFQNGDYILLGTMRGSDSMTDQDRLYRPGDRVTVSKLTEASEFHEEKDENGETVSGWYDNLEQKEYEVMAVVDIPYSMNTHRYSANCMDMVFPRKEFGRETVGSERFAVSYRVEQEKQAAFEAAVKDYTENISDQMGYMSKDMLRKEFNGMVRVIATMGIALASVIVFIGILNFINAVVTGILSRKREFAMLQSIGMTNRQLCGMLVMEGICYVGIAGVVSLILGSLMAWKLLSALNHVILFFSYRFQILPFLLMIPLLLAVAAAAPAIAYRRMNRRSIVERLREAE